jgi:hypothetical protein
MIVPLREGSPGEIVLSPSHVVSVGFAVRMARPAPVYSVRDNQVCLHLQDWCFKILRSDAGTMFSGLYFAHGRLLGSPRIANQSHIRSAKRRSSSPMTSV